MTNNDEKNLLLSIKTIPIILFLIITIIGITIAIYINKTNFNNEIKKVKDTYIKSEKQIIKNEVLKIHNNILSERNLTKEKLKVNIKEKVNMAHSIATSLYEKYKNTKSKQEIKKMIQDALVNIRFNDGRGYFFIYSLDYECILLPVARHLEGKNFYNFQDGKGMYLTRAIVKQMKEEKEGYLNWWYHKPQDMKKQYEKIGFNKYFEPLDWFIGTGEYVKDFEETVKSSVTARLSNYKYGQDGYVFIFDNNMITLSHPNKQEVGLNKEDFQDKNGVNIAKEIFTTAEQKDGGFVQYTFTKQSINKEIDKISYVMKFQEWDWVIGSGFYTDDLKDLIKKKKNELENLHKEQVDTIILVFIVLMVLIIILSLLLSYAIQNRFESYKRKAQQKDKMITEQSKMAAMGEMIGNIAHQWRQPLSAISTAATGMLAQKEYNLLDDKQFAINCNAINENAQYLSKTIDDFKNFIKGERTKKYFNLRKKTESFINLVEGSIKKHNIELIVDIEEKVNIDGYENELIQCFINIFNNAKDALTANTKTNRFISISAHTDKKNTIIKFRDNGKGIPQDVLPKIFEPYFTTKHQSQGTGLGLSMTYKFVVTGMHGTITAQNISFNHNNTTYQGAEITIIIPI